MIALVLVAAIALSIIDMKALKKEEHTKEILVYAGAMLIAVCLSVWYTLNIYRISIADILLGLFKLKG